MNTELKKDKLNVKIYDTRKQMGENAAEEAAIYLKNLLSKQEQVNIIFAAAPSQNEFLESLAITPGIEWKRINALHMDEYIGLDKNAPQGFGNFLKDRIFDKVPFKSVNYLDGQDPDPVRACKAYEKVLSEFPVDIVFMGIGENGHIAFNDPHVADFNDTKGVKIVDLDDKCRHQQVNDGCFKYIDEVPTHALTLTIPALLKATRIFCIVPAQTKAWAVNETLTGKISEHCPASILRTHPHATLYADKDSAALFLQFLNR
ncbi:glucosamine-6-phosphate deaminase [Coprobacter sp.]